MPISVLVMRENLHWVTDLSLVCNKHILIKIIDLKLNSKAVLLIVFE